ncbi:hypothetical protein [Prosthecobacter debontii]|nr:hypothetical protein [Prosthecobacter debontii]
MPAFLQLCVTLPIVFMMAGCAALIDHQLAAYHSKKPRVYGASSLPVTVTVQAGFLRPGTYHLPQGTTPGDLLEKAQLADVVVEIGLTNKKCGIYLEQIQGGKLIAWLSLGWPSEEYLRRPLADGAIVAVADHQKWHL